MNRSIRDESPLLLNPYRIDPSKHLAFRKEIIVITSKRNKKLAGETIIGYGLDSVQLNEARRDRLAEIQAILEAVEELVIHNKKVPNKAVSVLLKSISPKGEFSAMICSNLAVRINEVLAKRNT